MCRKRRKRLSTKPGLPFRQTHRVLATLPQGGPLITGHGMVCWLLLLWRLGFGFCWAKGCREQTHGANRDGCSGQARHGMY